MLVYISCDVAPGQKDKLHPEQVLAWGGRPVSRFEVKTFQSRFCFTLAVFNRACVHGLSMSCTIAHLTWPGTPGSLHLITGTNTAWWSIDNKETHTACSTNQSRTLSTSHDWFLRPVMTSAIVSSSSVFKEAQCVISFSKINQMLFGYFYPSNK